MKAPSMKINEIDKIHKLPVLKISDVYMCVHTYVSKSKKLHPIILYSIAPSLNIINSTSFLIFIRTKNFII